MTKDLITDNLPFFLRHTTLLSDSQEVWSWHIRRGSVERSIPSWEQVKICRQLDSERGWQRLSLALRSRFFWKKCILLIRFFQERGYLLVRQKKGPFVSFEHRIAISSHGVVDTEVFDRAHFQLHWPWLLGTIRKQQVCERFARFLDYKYTVLRSDLAVFRDYLFTTPLKILVSGSSGLVGSRLVTFLRFVGHEVYTLDRSPNHDPYSICFDTDSGAIEHTRLNGFDVVIHLRGENIAERWTKKKRTAILKSRRDSTTHLIRVLSEIHEPPSRFFCASAIGYYGNQGSILIDESTPIAGNSFLSSVCQQWEAACYHNNHRGMEVVHLRFGAVLSSMGGILKKILPLYRCGLGGVLGDGQQYMSWITIDDAIYAIYHIIMNIELKGAFNIVSPYPLTNGQFSIALAKYVRMHQGFAAPSWVLRILHGKMADEVLLSSQRALPVSLLSSGFTFRYPTLEAALPLVVR